MAFLAVIWLLYTLRLGIGSAYGEGVVRSMFVVRFSHLEYVWTWVTAPFGHGNLAHILFNSIVAVYIIPAAERDLGFRKTSIAYVVGGGLCAVAGTVLVVLVRRPFVSDAATAGGIGSSIGLFVLLGVVLRRHWSYQNPLLAGSGIRIANSTLFGTLLVISLGGVGFDIWRESAGSSIPGLGHHYHAVGLVIGAVLSEIVSACERREDPD